MALRQMPLKRWDSRCLSNRLARGPLLALVKLKPWADVKQYIEEALCFDRKLVLEECVVGQEIEVAVLGDADGEVLTSCVGEIAPAQEFYTYSAKYDDEESRLFIRRVSHRRLLTVCVVLPNAYSDPWDASVLRA